MVSVIILCHNNAKYFKFFEWPFLGDTDQIKNLVEEGVNMSLRFYNGETPIHVAAERGNVKHTYYIFDYHVINVIEFF